MTLAPARAPNFWGGSLRWCPSQLPVLGPRPREGAALCLRHRGGAASLNRAKTAQNRPEMALNGHAPHRGDPKLRPHALWPVGCVGHVVQASQNPATGKKIRPRGEGAFYYHFGPGRVARVPGPDPGPKPVIGIQGAGPSRLAGRGGVLLPLWPGPFGPRPDDLVRTFPCPFGPVLGGGGV